MNISKKTAKLIWIKIEHTDNKILCDDITEIGSLLGEFCTSWSKIGNMNSIASPFSISKWKQRTFTCLQRQVSE